MSALKALVHAVEDVAEVVDVVAVVAAAAEICLTPSATTAVKWVTLPVLARMNVLRDQDPRGANVELPLSSLATTAENLAISHVNVRTSVLRALVLRVVVVVVVAAEDAVVAAAAALTWTTSRAISAMRKATLPETAQKIRLRASSVTTAMIWATTLATVPTMPTSEVPRGNRKRDTDGMSHFVPEKRLWVQSFCWGNKLKERS